MYVFGSSLLSRENSLINICSMLTIDKYKKKLNKLKDEVGMAGSKVHEQD